MLAKLASIIEDSENRLLVIENLWEEHGNGNSNLFHTNSYLQYLQSLGFNKNTKDIIHNPWIDEWIENTMHKNYTATEYAAYLAGIEYIYARISKSISDKLQTCSLVCEQNHYENHSVLDYQHAAELLDVAIKCKKQETEDEIYIIFKQSIKDFLYMFEKMVILTEIQSYEISKEKIAFYYGREDSSIETLVVNKLLKDKSNYIPQILMICSGGENCIELLKMNTPVNIIALDINPYQISLAQKKIDSIYKKNNINEEDIVFNVGKFEKLFQVLKNSFNENELLGIAQEDNESLKKLEYICLHLFSNKTLEIIFTDQATKYSSKSFSEHFYNVFKEQIKYYYDANLAESNIGCVLGKTTAISYKGIINTDSSIHYFNGTFNDYFKINNVKDNEINYDIIDISNISDWMNKENTIEVIKLVYSHLNNGGYLIGRKLLGDYDWIDLINVECQLNMEIEEVKDKTSFYTQTIIAKKK